MFTAFLTGIFLGLFFFGGLHFTVKYLNNIKHPALFMMLSMIFRLFVLMYGFYFVLQKDIYHLAVALAAVIITRQLLIHLFKK